MAMHMSLPDSSSPSFLGYKTGLRTSYRAKLNEATKREMLRCNILYQQKKIEARRKRDERNQYFHGEYTP